MYLFLSMETVTEKHSFHIPSGRTVSVGSRIELFIDGERYVWDVVDEADVNISEGKISPRSEFVKTLFAYLWARDRSKRAQGQ